MIYVKECFPYKIEPPKSKYEYMGRSMFIEISSDQANHHWRYWQSAYDKYGDHNIANFT